MRKWMCWVLLASLLASSTPIGAVAADSNRKLSELLGVEESFSVSPTPRITRPLARPATSRRIVQKQVVEVSETSTLSELSSGTPQFPILRKLIILYVLWVILNGYR